MVSMADVGRPRPLGRAGHDSVLLAPGQALLRWRGIAGQLHLPTGSYMQGIEFDVHPRPRAPHEQYGWKPLDAQGEHRQPSPQQFLGHAVPHIFGGVLAASAERLMARVVTRWWRGLSDQLAM